MRPRLRRNPALAAVLLVLVLSQAGFIFVFQGDSQTSPSGASRESDFSFITRDSSEKKRSEPVRQRIHSREELHQSIVDAVAVRDVTRQSLLLPSWIVEYSKWHRLERDKLTKHNFRNSRVLVMRCLSCDESCGGTADRLVPVPFMMYLAHQTKRLLFVHWERPAPIDNFLTPMMIDWRLPDFLKTSFNCSENPVGSIENIVNAAESSTPFMSIRFQSASYGSDYYDRERVLRDPTTEPDFDHVFRDIWRSTFQPSPEVLNAIEETAWRLRVFPGEYVAVHLRGLYGVKDRSKDLLQSWARNGVNCGSQIKPGGPIYFASDSKHATEFAVSYGNFRAAGSVVARSVDESPLHLDKHNSSGAALSAFTSFYDTFVDLYLMGLSQCVTFSRGGFGRWSALISFNYSCSYRFMYSSKKKFTCRWTK